MLVASAAKLNCGGSDKSYLQRTSPKNSAIVPYRSPDLLVAVSPKNMKKEL